MTSKQKEFNIFKELCFLVKNKFHLKIGKNYDHCFKLAKSIMELYNELKLRGHLLGFASAALFESKPRAKHETPPNGRSPSSFFFWKKCSFH